MTPEEYRGALNRLSPQDFARFRERWRGARPTVDACVQEFVYASDDKRLQYERTIIFRLRELGIVDLKTEDEKILDVARDSAQAAKDSARAAEVSASSAKASVRWSQWSVVIAVFAVLVSFLLKSCVPEAPI